MRAVNVTLDLHSHRVPCAGAQTLHIPSHGSHLLSCSLFPSYHLPSILLTAARQGFENLPLGHVTCLVCLATLRAKSKLLTGPKGPQHPAGDSLVPTSRSSHRSPEAACSPHSRLSPSWSLCPHALPSPLPLLPSRHSNLHSDISSLESPRLPPITLPRLLIPVACITS